jgi:hypothetical protein
MVPRRCERRAAGHAGPVPRAADTTAESSSVARRGAGLAAAVAGSCAVRILDDALCDFARRA